MLKYGSQHYFEFCENLGRIMKKFWARMFVFITGTAGLAALFQMLWGHHSLMRNLTVFTLSYRVTLLAAAVLLVLLTSSSLGIFLYSLLRKKSFGRSVFKLVYVLSHQKVFLVLILLLLAMALIAGQWTLSIPEVENQNQRSLLVHLRPFFLWLILVSFLVVSVLVISGKRYQHEFFHRFSRVLLISALVVGVLLYLTQVAGIGFSEESETMGLFHPLGFPLLGYQVFFAWLGCSLLVGVFFWAKRAWKVETVPPLLVDAVLCLMLFVLAFALWNSVPLKPNWFVDIPRPPNYEHYPNSDAVYYDTNAQNLLAMGQFWEYRKAKSIGRRSVMLFFHMIMHAVGGLGYEEITSLLVAGFALIPVLLFLLGANLHSRWAGLLAGVLFILRHRNGLMLGDVVTGANVKLLMSEIPTTFGVVLSVLLGAVWLQAPRRRWPLGVFAGAAIGLTTLIRIENILLLPFLSLPALLVYQGRLWNWVRGLLLPTAGLILVVSPWGIRNGMQTGKFYLESPGNKIGLILDTLRLDPDKKQNEDAFQQDVKMQGFLHPVQYSSQVLISARGSNLSRLENDGNQQAEITTQEIIVNHYTNSLVQSVLYLPTTPLGTQPDFLSQLINRNLQPTYGGVLFSPETYVRSLPYWFEGWDGKLKKRTLLGFVGTVFLITWGLHSLFQKHRGSALVPLAMMLSGVTAYALIRRTGGRFIQKADWVTSFYFAVGLVDLTRAGLRAWVGGRRDHSTFQEGYSPSPLLESLKGWRGWLVVLLVPLLLGSVLPGVEILLPDRYPDQILVEKISFISQKESNMFSTSQEKVIQGLLQKGGKAVYGRALYPRYFEKGDSLIDRKKPYQYARMHFYLTGTDALYVNLPRSETAAKFPHGVDALVIGCPGGTTIQAVLAILYDEEGNVDQVLWREGDIEEFSGCPLPSPVEE